MDRARLSGMTRPHRILGRVLMRASGVLVLLGVWQVLSATGILPGDSFPSMTMVVRSVVNELSGASGWQASPS